MSKDEILVIKVNEFWLSPEDMHNLRQQIIKQKEDCVLLMQIRANNDVKYMVKDIEGDIIYINHNDLDGAIEAFDDYDLERIRADKKKLFEDWLKEFAEA